MRIGAARTIDVLSSVIIFSSIVLWVNAMYAAREGQGAFFGWMLAALLGMGLINLAGSTFRREPTPRLELVGQIVSAIVFSYIALQFYLELPRPFPPAVYEWMWELAGGE